MQKKVQVFNKLTELRTQLQEIPSTQLTKATAKETWRWLKDLVTHYITISNQQYQLLQVFSIEDPS